jgi:hypothetical protein
MLWDWSIPMTPLLSWLHFISTWKQTTSNFLMMICKASRRYMVGFHCFCLVNPTLKSRIPAVFLLWDRCYQCTWQRKNWRKNYLACWQNSSVNWILLATIPGILMYIWECLKYCWSFLIEFNWNFQLFYSSIKLSLLKFR